MKHIKFVFLFSLFFSYYSYTSELAEVISGSEEMTSSELIFSLGEPVEKIIEQFIECMAPYADREAIENIFSLRLINSFLNNIFEIVFFRINAKNKNQITRALMNTLKSTEEDFLFGKDVKIYKKMRRPGRMVTPYFQSCVLGSTITGIRLFNHMNLFDQDLKKLIIVKKIATIWIVFYPCLLFIEDRQSFKDVVQNIKNALFNHFEIFNYGFAKNQFNQTFEHASSFFKKLILEKYVENLFYKKNVVSDSRLNQMFNFSREVEDKINIEHPFFGSIIFKLKTILNFKDLIQFLFVKINKEDSTFLDVSLLPDWIFVSDPRTIGPDGHMVSNDELDLDRNYNFKQDVKKFDDFLKEFQLNKNTKVLCVEHLYIPNLEQINDTLKPKVAGFSLINLLDRIARKCQPLIPSASFGSEMYYFFKLENFDFWSDEHKNYFEPIINNLKKYIIDK